MSAFLSSTAALLLGPLLFARGRRRPGVRQFLDGFVLVTVAGIVCVYIIPDAIHAGGRLALAFLVIGLAFPILVEKTFRNLEHEAHVFIVVLAALGLIVHALIDGIALLPGVGGTAAVPQAMSGWHRSFPESQLALGVILHRIPVGMAIWWSVRPNFGTPAAVLTFALLIGATAASYFLGAPVVELAGSALLGHFQAFVAGSLVHVVAFGLNHEHADKAENARTFTSWGFRTGIVSGMFMVFVLPYLD